MELSYRLRRPRSNNTKNSMNQNDPKKQTGAEAVSSSDWLAPVELIGGPLCGNKVTWPAGEHTADLKYYGGVCTYEYEGGGKAIYARG